MAENLDIWVVIRYPTQIHSYPPGCVKRRACYPMEDHVFKRTIDEMITDGLKVMVLELPSKRFLVHG